MEYVQQHSSDMVPVCFLSVRVGAVSSETVQFHGKSMQNRMWAETYFFSCRDNDHRQELQPGEEKPMMSVLMEGRWYVNNEDDPAKSRSGRRCFGSVQTKGRDGNPVMVWSSALFGSAVLFMVTLTFGERMRSWRDLTESLIRHLRLHRVKTLLPETYA